MKDTYLDQLRERLQYSGLSVAVYLNRVEETDFSFGAVAEGFKQSNVSLWVTRSVSEGFEVNRTTHVDVLYDKCIQLFGLGIPVDAVHDRQPNSVDHVELADLGLCLPGLEVLEHLSQYYRVSSRDQTGGLEAVRLHLRSSPRQRSFPSTGQRLLP